MRGRMTNQIEKATSHERERENATSHEREKGGRQAMR